MDKKTFNEHTTESQKSIICSIISKCKNYFHSANKDESESITFTPHHSNTLGLLGRRGLGKSTIMNILYQLEHDPTINLPQKKPLPFFVLEPLDCTILEKTPNPISSVLIHLLSFISPRSSTNSNRHNQFHFKSPESPAPNDHTTKQLERIIENHYEISEGYRDLVQDLSSSPAEYGHYLSNGTKKQLKLKKSLFNFFEDFFKAQKSEHGFVIILDDFDLIPGKAVRKWIEALLDELQQDRLIFLVTADKPRLQHLSWDSENQEDEKTGQNQVYKLIPEFNTFELKEWTKKEALDFKISDQNTTRSLLCNLEAPLKSQLNLIKELIPTDPRGLTDFHKVLKNRLLVEHLNIDSDFISQLLALLASSRQEFFFSRRLKSNNPFSWITDLKFPTESPSVETWLGMVDIASTRKIPNENDAPFKPLPELQPSLPHHSVFGNKIHHIALVNPYPSMNNRWSFGQNPNWTEPLRDDAVRVHPLSDAKDRSPELWTELLLNLGMARSPDSPKNLHLRNRTQFFHSWKPLSFRAEQACIRRDMTESQLQDFFEDRLYLPDRAAFSWLSFSLEKEESAPGANSLHLQIGWPPLIEALRGNRNPMLTRSIAKLLIDPASIPTRFDRPSDENWLEIIPGEVWAMILLADGLYRCPWSTFSRPLRWLLITQIGLSAALIRTAYAYGLFQCGLTQFDIKRNEKSDPEAGDTTDLSDNDPKTNMPSLFSETQQKMIDMLLNRNPSYLLQKSDQALHSVALLEEEDLLQRLNNLFQDDLEETIKDNQDTLSLALKAYLNAPFYTSVKDKIAEIVERWSPQDVE